MAQQQPHRYIPPHARRGLSTQPDRKEAQSLDELTRQTDDQEVFVVALKSQTTYSDLPAQIVEEKEEKKSSHILHIQKFELRFEQQKLRQLMKWFRHIGKSDPNAVIEFPSTLSKGHRQQVHQTAQSFGLGTSSQGFREKRFISVYSVEKAILGVGRLHLAPDEQTKAYDIWHLVKMEGDSFVKFSFNEIQEMILADSLDPMLQELWDKRQSLLPEEFTDKCKVDDT